jgi:hypothetical protein
MYRNYSKKGKDGDTTLKFPEEGFGKSGLTFVDLLYWYFGAVKKSMQIFFQYIHLALSFTCYARVSKRLKGWIDASWSVQFKEKWNYD